MPNYGYEDIALANAAQPRMMPSAPGGGNAGMLYGQDMARQDQYLNNAATMVGMGNQRTMQENEEFRASAPGRMANIEAGNIDAQQQLEMAKQGMSMKIAKQVTELSQAKRKELEAKSNIFAQLAKAKPQDIPDILDYYDDEAVWNGKDLRKLSPDKVQILASGIMEGLKQSNMKYVQALDTGGQRAASYGAKNEKDIQIARIQAQAKEAVARINANRAQANPKTIESLYSNIVSSLMENGMELSEALSDPSVQELHAKIIEKAKAGRTPAAALPGIADIFGKGGPKPAAETPKSQFTVGKSYTDAKGATKTYLGGDPKLASSWK